MGKKAFSNTIKLATVTFTLFNMMLSILTPVRNQIPITFKHTIICHDRYKKYSATGNMKNPVYYYIHGNDLN